MKKIIAIMFSLIMFSSVVLAANMGNNISSGQKQNKIIDRFNDSDFENNQSGPRNQIAVQRVERIREMIRNRRTEMNQETEGLGERVRSIRQNQNRVRLAVHSLLAMENFTGGIGRNISQIAREFNNSVKTTLNAEEKIKNRGWFSKLISGGDEEAADQIQGQVSRNQQRLQKLERLREECNCSEEVKSLMQEQIQNMEQEQNRLRELAQEEKNNKGLFGWLWK